MHDLGALADPPEQRLGSPSHAADGSFGLLELPQQPAPDIAGHSGEQHTPSVMRTGLGLAHAI